MNCEHGFVVRDIEDGNRFLCRECNTRFARYPQKRFWAKEYERNPYWHIIREANKKFITSAFANQMNRPGFVMAKGAPTKQLTYNLPLADKATQSFAFLGDQNE